MNHLIDLKEIIANYKAIKNLNLYMFLNFIKGIFIFLVNDIKSIFISRTNSLKYWKLFLYASFFLFMFLILFQSFSYCYYKSKPDKLQHKTIPEKLNLNPDLSL